jgi:hypothetical protein
MDTQLMMAVAAGVALFLVFAFQVYRSARDGMDDSPVSATWLAERKRVKDDHQ